VALIGAVMLLLCTAGHAAEASWNLRDHIPVDQVAVQSHRGAGVLMPENSVEAFELAWKLGTIPEADLRTTRDGVIVTFHDENFQRILPNASPEMKARGIKDLTWDEVSKLDIGAWKGKEFAGQHVMRMTDMYPVIAKDPKRRMYIDIKNVDLEQLAREARQAGVCERLILASTDYKVIREWKRLAPESATLHWMGGTEEVLAKRFEDLRKTNFADITQLQIHVRTSGKGKAQKLTPSPEFLKKAGDELRTHGIVFQTLPWGSKDPKLFRKLMDLGAMSFATDYPDVMMKTIREYYGERPAKK
jgi:glycerophosphoryl diester phosphodiesterase